MSFKQMFKEKKIQLMLIIALILIINIAGANSPNVTIEPSAPYTTESLTCSFTFTDYDTYEINWYKNDIFTIANSSNVSSTLTTKNEIWTCEVKTYQGGPIKDEGNKSVQIRNSAPDDLKIYESGVELFEYHELYEDESYNFIFNATDPDGDTLEYSITDPGTLCPNINGNTGQLLCEPTHTLITGSSEPSNEYPINYTIRLRSEETTTEGFSAFRDFQFTILPVNDQAEFITEIPDLSLNALSEWEYLIEAFDEELNYPLNFWLSTNEGLGLTLIAPTETNPNTTRILTFPEGEPTNDDVGDWSVTIFVEDINGSNASRLPTNYTFNLQINRTNEIPYFITDFSNITGVQGEPFNFTIEARDNDVNDSLSFAIHFLSNDTIDTNCTEEYFVWDENLTTIANSSTNATATINIANLTNNHVICRMANLEVRDQDGSSMTTPIFFNITNSNDPPQIHEMSNYEENIGSQKNISNLSVSLFVSPALYKVNATDPDQLTYDANNKGIITYETNDTRFNINPETGILNLTFTGAGMIGNWEVLVTATDNVGLNDSIIMNIEILLNEPPIINIGEQQLFNQNNDIIILFNTTDNDGDAVNLTITSNNPEFNQEIYLDSYNIASSIMQESANITTWRLNLSEWIMNKTLSHLESNRPDKTLYSNELVGIHNISITAYDQHQAFSEDSKANLIFTVYNENDAPFFDMNPRNNVTDEQINFNNMALGHTRTEILYVTDFDLFLTNFNETLTYAVLNYSNITLISFNKHISSEDTATLTFIPQEKGQQFVEVQVNDSFGASFNQTINFTVYEETEPPRFLEVSPYYENGETNIGYRTTTGLTQPLYVEWIENSTLTFDADIEIDSEIFITDPEDGEANTLHTKLYVNEVLVGQKSNVIPKVNSDYQVYFDFFKSGINNVTMQATDEVGSTSNWTWQVDVENVNRNPIYCENSLSDISFAGSISWPNYFSYFSHQRFYDPDDDPANTGPNTINPCTSGFYGVTNLSSLTFDYNTTRGNCDADFIFDESTITIKGYSEGMCYVTFSATDEYNETINSDEVIIEILEAITDGQVTTEKTITITETITVPIDHDVDVPKPVKIIYPGDAIYYQNQTIDVPIIIKNNWTKELNGILLHANPINKSNIEKDENLSISFSTNKINTLPVDQQQEIIMTLTDYRKPGPIIISIFAEVSDPEFTDSETIIIAGLEMAGDDPQSVRALVTYARDLLTASPECAELNDLLNNAQRILDQGRVQEALEMIDAAINGCGYLMSQDETFRREQPGALKAGLTFTSDYWSEIIIGSIAFIFIAIAFYVIAFIRLSLKDKQ